MKNAVILAAGTASRFVPLSETMPKGLLEVRGEILLERQIRQLKEAGVEDIFVVVGYRIMAVTTTSRPSSGSWTVWTRPI